MSVLEVHADCLLHSGREEDTHLGRSNSIDQESKLSCSLCICCQGILANASNFAFVDELPCSFATELHQHRKEQRRVQ